jgi:hypothetical protein
MVTLDGVSIFGGVVSSGSLLLLEQPIKRMKIKKSKKLSLDVIYIDLYRLKTAH